MVGKIIGAIGVVGATIGGVVLFSPAAKFPIDVDRTPVAFYGEWEADTLMYQGIPTVTYTRDTIIYPSINHAVILSNIPADAIIASIKRDLPEESNSFEYIH